ncbi:hypothetical protein DFH09DRAFT_1476008 [Mycena vulgaris]|nr:hypothetical protein DFH09DRAFT_1476008 [Mycena vulgaris]
MTRLRVRAPQSQASKPGLEWVYAIPYSELPCSAELMQVITHSFCGAPPANSSARNNFSQSGQPLLDDKIELSTLGHGEGNAQHEWSYTFFALKPWLEPGPSQTKPGSLALALASKIPSQSQTKPSQSHGFRAKPSQQNTRSPCHCPVFFSPAAGGITDQGNRVRHSYPELNSDMGTAQSDSTSESGQSSGFPDLDDLISDGLKKSKTIWLDPHVSSMVFARSLHIDSVESLRAFADFVRGLGVKKIQGEV